MQDAIKHPGLDEWLASGNTGASSKAIARHLTGHECDGSYPKDAGAFDRCEGLLIAVPSLRPSIPRMADLNAYWAALVPEWETLRTLGSTETDAAIKAIIRPIEDADPDCAHMSDVATIRSGGKVTFKGASGAESEDDQFSQAVMAVWEFGSASTSNLQSCLGINYNAAARLIERMEELGIVSKPDLAGMREVRSPETIQATLATMKKATAAAGGDEKLGQVLLKTIIAAMKEQDAKNRAKSGKPPMRPDPAFDAAASNAYGVTADELRQFIERYEQLEAEKKDVTENQKELMAEAKGRGYDTKIMRKVIALRKRKPDEIAEEEAVLEMYKTALGMR